ncbi:O-methyltransferase [Purpureocillium lilacinum]|uniref:O-methyltransferase n=1 Tax=Purpureocillium lilacinum TaxID=33203 RepID=A0A2U3ECC7_PURLI|nr:O-methyltransferase [Purpureocillium lilacinum]
MTALSESKNMHRVRADEAARLKMQDSLRSAAEAMETSNDTMLRLFNGALEVPMVKAACDIGLFKTLVASETPLTLEELAYTTKAEPAFLGRVLRYLAATRFIAETGKDQFGANLTTQSLADPAIEGSLNYIFAIAIPAYMALPDFMQQTSFQTPPGTKCAWQQSVKTDMDWFPYYKQHPKQLSYFQKLMSVPRDGDWLDVVSFADEAANVSPDSALFVDIGGNIGHQSKRLRAKYPTLPGKVIVQDLPETVSVAAAAPGVEFMAYDFFTPQPVEGARFYYMRTVLHDWDEENSIKILKNTAAAMTADSQLLIDEMVLPNKDVHWWSACLDLHMYTMLNALERTVDQWHDLLGKAGLKLVDIRTELDRWNAVSSRQTCKFLSNMAFAVTSMDEKKVQPISPVVTDYPASTEVQCSMYDTPQCPLSVRIPPRPPAPVDAQLNIPVSCTGVPGSKQYDESDHVALHPQEPRCFSHVGFRLTSASGQGPEPRPEPRPRSGPCAIDAESRHHQRPATQCDAPLVPVMMLPLSSSPLGMNGHRQPVQGDNQVQMQQQMPPPDSGTTPCNT